MKKIFTLSILTIGLVMFFTGCVKNREYIDESYWLSKERGEVVLSDPYCQYFVIETYDGYTILRSYDGYKPGEGSVVYGNFSSYGTKDYFFLKILKPGYFLRWRKSLHGSKKPQKNVRK